MGGTGAEQRQAPNRRGATGGRRGTFPAPPPRPGRWGAAPENIRQLTGRVAELVQEVAQEPGPVRAAGQVRDGGSSGIALLRASRCEPDPATMASVMSSGIWSRFMRSK